MNINRVQFNELLRLFVREFNEKIRRNDTSKHDANYEILIYQYSILIITL